jgi:hypothetical protein
MWIMISPMPEIGRGKPQDGDKDEDGSGLGACDIRPESDGFSGRGREILSSGEIRKSGAPDRFPVYFSLSRAFSLLSPVIIMRFLWIDLDMMYLHQAIDTNESVRVFWGA